MRFKKKKFMQFDLVKLLIGISLKKNKVCEKPIRMNMSIVVLFTK